MLNLHPFLNTGVISPIFHAIGNVTKFTKLLNRDVSIGDNTGEVSFSMRAKIPSEPVDSEGHIPFSALETSDSADSVIVQKVKP